MTILYHYCSSSTFDSILSSRSIWLSSMGLSNDTMEGKLIAALFNRLSKQDGFDKESIKDMLEAVKFLEEIYDGLCFCLSEEGDLLSQWRGYASDAFGFSIGFSKEYLLLLAESIRGKGAPELSLQKVEYDVNAQEKFVSPTYESIKDMINSGRLKTPNKLGLLSLYSEEEINEQVKEYRDALKNVYSTILKLSPQLFALKTEAFREEKEWRLISNTLREEYFCCAYRALNDRIVPYLNFDLTKLEMEPISEIIIGPKNLTPINVITSMIKRYGLNNVKVRRSSATYR